MRVFAVENPLIIYRFKGWLERTSAARWVAKCALSASPLLIPCGLAMPGVEN
jgi:hypothetical protein